jgi:hypothetical protein
VLETNTRIRTNGKEVYTFGRFSVWVGHSFVRAGKVPVLQGNNPPSYKGVDHMGGCQPSLSKFPNTLDTAFHFVSNRGECLPYVTDNTHKAFSLDHTIIAKANIKPFLFITFPGRFDWK